MTKSSGAKKDQRAIFIGVMSGTSLDGLDIAAVTFQHNTPTLIAAHTANYPSDLLQALHALCIPGDNEIDRMGETDQRLGAFIGQEILSFIQANKLNMQAISAIGSHGQTIRHRPHFTSPFTLQIGDPNRIASCTGIPVVADFRRKDMALGGQGAPLAPGFHRAAFQSSTVNRIILNLGGIANITVLKKVGPTQAEEDKRQNILGYDTGPANGLMNAWIQTCLGKAYDHQGSWASNGSVSQALLSELLKENYLSLEPPKSTGPELFNLAWLEERMISAAAKNLASQDVQRTLLEFSATTISNAIAATKLDQGEILACGGGVHNSSLMLRLAEMLQPDWTVNTTTSQGVNADFLEAIAFAWFAKRSLEGLTSSVASVTGATKDAVLGAIYPAP